MVFLRMELKSIEESVRLIVACGYSLIAIELIRSRLAPNYPMFTVYCASMIVDLIWNPLSVGRMILIEPWLVSLRFCAIIEAASNATALLSWHRPRVRRTFLLFGLAISFPVVVLVHGVLTGNTQMAWFHSIRLTLHAGFAMMCLAQCLCYMLDGSGLDRRALRHYVILSVYMTVRAVAQTFKPGAGDWDYYYRYRIGYFTVISICLLAWIMSLAGRRESA